MVVNLKSNPKIEESSERMFKDLKNRAILMFEDLVEAVGSAVRNER